MREEERYDRLRKKSYLGIWFFAIIKLSNRRLMADDLFFHMFFKSAAKVQYGLR